MWRSGLSLFRWVTGDYASGSTLGRFIGINLVKLPPSGLEPSRPAADATREVGERLLLDGVR
jgi:hypothetical protein